MRYVLRNGQWVSPLTGEAMELPKGDVVCMPMIQSDQAPFKSPVTGKMVDGRSAHREDLKRSGCRVMDPSEGPATCRTEKWAKKLKMEHDPNGGRPKHWADWQSATRSTG
jgi:hypothetical protein